MNDPRSLLRGIRPAFTRSVFGNIMVQPASNQKKLFFEFSLAANLINYFLVMRKTKNVILVVLHVVIWLFALSSLSIAQNVEEAPVHTPAVSPETEAWLEELASKAETREAEFAFVHCDDAMDFGDCREKYKEFVKRDPRFFGRILGYAAARENDVSICDILATKTDTCPGIFDNFSRMRKSGENQCKSLSGEHKYFCEVLNNNCEGLTEEWTKDVCQGYNQGNLALLKRGLTSGDFCAQTGNCTWDEIDNVEILSIYQGFRAHWSKETCKNHTSVLEGSHAYLCEVLFSESPINDILDGVATDLAYYLLSKDRKAPFLCKNIKNNKLKAGCLSPDSDKYFKDTF